MPDLAYTIADAIGPVGGIAITCIALACMYLPFRYLRQEAKT